MKSTILALSVVLAATLSTSQLPSNLPTSFAQEDTAVVLPAVEGLTPDLYDGIALTVTPTTDATVQPGDVISFEVVIENTGDQSIVYPHGSGSATTPSAIQLTFDGLQTILPEDRLGPQTMDMRYEELKPGESLQYTLHVMAIEPNESFDLWTYDLYTKEDLYIGDLDASALQVDHPEVVLAPSGTYNGTLVFQYTLPDGNTSVLANPNGYAAETIHLQIG